jgi:hypothetical protein
LLPASWTDSGPLIELVSLAALFAAAAWVVRKALTARS